jgi:hypothetical protein
MGCRWPRISSTTVNMRPNRNVPGGAYEGIKQLPHHGHEFEYRITARNKSASRAKAVMIPCTVRR